MGVSANTSETYTHLTIREDLQEQYNMISPTETPFQMVCGTESVTQPNYDWPVVELAAVNSSNRVIEGENAPANDGVNTAFRLENYTQISDKVAEVTHTAEATTGAANNLQRMGSQIMLKLKELKRDTETMFLQNIAANTGASGTARVSAGLPAFLRTNVSSVAGGANPTLSGGSNGYPNATATGGTTPIAWTEASLNAVIQLCWEQGASPSLIMVGGGNKRRLSQAFTGNSSRYKDSIDKKLVNSVDFYDSDFGELTVVPNRFQPTIAANNHAIYILDPEFLSIVALEETKQKDLAKTGHADRKLIWQEKGLKVHNEKAHGIVRDTTGLLV